jgi:hypothetical protein
MTSLYAPAGSAREVPSSGSHIAVCFQMVDLGTQDTSFGPRAQVRLSFEPLDEFMADGRPFIVGKNYTFSGHLHSNLRRDIEGWLARPVPDFSRLDLAERVGAVVVVGLQRATARSGRDYARITSLAHPPAGAALRQRSVNPPLILSLRQFDQAVYAQLPEWLRALIAQSPEYQRAIGQGDLLGHPPRPRLAAPAPAPARRITEDFDDEIPF